MNVTDLYATPLTVLRRTRLSLSPLSPLWFSPSSPRSGALHRFCLSVLPRNCLDQSQERLRNWTPAPQCGHCKLLSSAPSRPAGNILLPLWSARPNLPPLPTPARGALLPRTSPLPRPNPNQQVRPDSSYLAAVTFSPKYLIHASRLSFQAEHLFRVLCTLFLFL